MKSALILCGVSLLFACGGASTAANDAGTVPPPNVIPGPTSTAIAPVTDDAIYVVNGGDDSMSVIDAQTNALLGTIKFSGAFFPHHVNVSADGSKLAVAFPGMDMSGTHSAMAGMKGAIAVLDAKTGATLVSRMLPAMNHNAVFSPDGHEIWTSSMTSPQGAVLVLDAATLAITHTIAVDDTPAEVTFSNDGTRAFVANIVSDTISVIDTARYAVTDSVNVWNAPIAAWPGSDGSMYVTHEKSQKISQFDAKTLAVSMTYGIGFSAGMARTTADGQELWIADETDGKVVFNMTSMDMTMGDLQTGAGAHGLVCCTRATGCGRSRSGVT